MKRFLREIAVIIIAIAASSGATAQTKWHNPENAPFPVIQGQKYQEEEREGFYNRFPARAKDKVRKSVWNLSRQNAGESIVFTTDAKNITVRYTVALRHAMSHMPSTGVSGVDLYTTDGDGNEIWVAGKYSFKDTVTFRYNDIDIVNKARKYNRYTLYLPLYNELKWLEIGTEEGAAFRFEPTPSSKPIVAYGTSICQGACASRPGNSYQAMITRMLDCDHINLGFSGSAKAEPAIVEYLSGLNMSAFVCDYDHNAPSPEFLTNTHEKMFRSIREAQPDLPIIMMSRPKFYLSPEERERVNIMLQTYENALAAGDRNVYCIKGCDLLSEDIRENALVDNCHPTDGGFASIARVVEAKLREILKM